MSETPPGTTTLHTRHWSTLPVPTGADVALAAVTGLVVPVVVVVVALLTWRADVAEVWVLGAAVVVGWVGLWWVLVRRRGWGLRELGFTRPRRSLLHLLYQVPLAIIAGAGGAAAIGTALGMRPGGSGGTSVAATLSLGPAAIIVTILAAVLLAPALEEIVFRRVLLDWLVSRMPVPLAVVVSALAFAAVHVVPIAMIYVVFLGFFTALMRRWYGTLWAPLLLHATNNAFVTGVALAALR